MKTFLAIVATVALVGCGPTIPVIGGSTGTTITTSPVSGTELHKAKLSVDIDPLLLQQCSALPSKALVKNPLPSQVLDVKTDESRLYFECAARHAKLVRVLQDALNPK